jgi:spore maturation protein CgeB
MKIFMFAPCTRWKYNWGNQLFRDEFARQHDVTQIGRFCKHPAGKIKDVRRIVEKYGEPDLIITAGAGTCYRLKGIGLLTHIPRVCYMVDYFPRNYKAQDNFLKQRKYDAVFLPAAHEVTRMRKQGYLPKNRIYLLPFGVDTTKYKKMDLPKKWDVMAVFSKNRVEYPNRHLVQVTLKRMKGVSVLTNKIIKKRYIEAINQSKLMVQSNDRLNGVSMRYTEALACGTCLLTDRPVELDLLGYIPDTHLVLYNEPRDLPAIVKALLADNARREAIATEGMNFVRQNHSIERRVQQWTQIVEEDIMRIRPVSNRPWKWSNF